MLHRVYFIENSAVGAIKIGTTTNVTSRMATLQTASPVRLRLLVDVPGDRAVEQRLHVHFAAFRLSGEWFTSEGVVPFVVALSAVRPDLMRHALATPSIVDVLASYETDARERRCEISLLRDELTAARSSAERARFYPIPYCAQCEDD